MAGMIRGFILTIAASIALTTSARAELTLCNRTSYRMDVALGLEKRANVETRGWFRLDPGQCRQALDGTLDCRHGVRARAYPTGLWQRAVAAQRPG